MDKIFRFASTILQKYFLKTNDVTVAEWHINKPSGLFNFSFRLLSIESDCTRRSIWRLHFCCVLCCLHWQWRKTMTGIGKICRNFEFALINSFMGLIFAPQRQNQQGEIKKLCKHVTQTINFSTLDTSTAESSLVTIQDTISALMTIVFQAIAGFDFIAFVNSWLVKITG